MLRTYVVVSSPIFSAVTISTLLNHLLGSSPRFCASLRMREMCVGRDEVDDLRSVFGDGQVAERDVRHA